jgi:hypothetical protein
MRRWLMSSLPFFSRTDTGTGRLRHTPTAVGWLLASHALLSGLALAQPSCYFGIGGVGWTASADHLALGLKMKSLDWNGRLSDLS